MNCYPKDGAHLTICHFNQDTNLPKTLSTSLLTTFEHNHVKKKYSFLYETGCLATYKLVSPHTMEMTQVTIVSMVSGIITRGELRRNDVL